MSRKMNIDKLFKSTLYQRDFPFDEGAWKDVEKMLDQHDKKIAGRWKWMGLFSVGLITLVAFLTLEQTQYTSGAEENGVQTVTGLSQGKTVNERVPEEAQPQQTRMLENGEKPLALVDENQPLAVNENGVIKKPTENKEPESIGIEKMAVTSIPAQKPVVSNELLPVDAEEVAAKVAEPDVPGSGKSLATLEPAGNTRTSESTPLTTSSSSDVAAINVQPKGEPVAIKTTMIDKTNLEGSVDLRLNKANMRIPATSLQLPVRLNSEPTAAYDASPGSKRMSVLTGWGVIAGAGVGNGIRRDDNQSATASRVSFIGLRYARPISGRFSIQSNVLYRRVGNLQARSEFENTEYDFGYTTTRTIIESKTLHYVGIPLYLNYYTGLFNLYAGMEYDWLLNVKSDVTVQQEGTFGEGQSSQTAKYGYKGHFQGYQLSAIGGVEYLINERLCVGIRLNYGLNQLNNPRYFSGVATQLTDLKITVNYTLKSVRR